MHGIRRVFSYVLAACLFISSCFAQADELIVSAAASLTNAFNDIGKEFEKNHPATKVILNYGASGALLQQISTGAPADIFASADQESMDKATAGTLIQPDTRINFARNTLVLAVPVASNLPLTSLQDLSAADVARIAVSKPETVLAGRYAKQALDAANLWDTLTPKFIYTQNVRQSLDYLGRAEVDAGFVYITDVAILHDKVRVAFEIPLETPILYPVAVVKSSSNSKLAQEFIGFVASESGQKILGQYGFAKP